MLQPKGGPKAYIKIPDCDDLFCDQQSPEIGKELQDRMDVLWEIFKARVLVLVQCRGLARLLG